MTLHLSSFPLRTKCGMLVVMFFLTLSARSTLLGQASDNPYDQVGVEHNESVKLILRSLESRPADGTQMETYRSILATRYDEKYLTDLTSIPEANTYEYMWRQIEGQFSAAFVSDLRAVEEYLQTERSVGEIWSHLGNLEKAVSTSYTEEEKLCYLIFLAVAKHSAKLWLPLWLGGENAISLIQFPPVNGEEDPAAASRISWWKVITTDASSAVAAAASSLAATGGVSAAPIGPGGIPPAGYYAVGGAVAGSVGSIIAQWDN